MQEMLKFRTIWEIKGKKFFINKKKNPQVSRKIPKIVPQIHLLRVKVIQIKAIRFKKKPLRNKKYQNGT